MTRPARCLMVQGTGSHVGKSVLVAALCRIFTQDGHRVLPFKAQNMALNSFVTPDGGELGRAQAVQAQACRVPPRVAMNPVLIKPTADCAAQVVVNGTPWANLSARDYHTRKAELLGHVSAALDELRADADIVVIEGAGSPAEINLRDNDIVNMAAARLAQAPVLLAGDIDRGGVFAALYGTVALLTEDEKRYVRGFIINRFRGDRTLLEPAFPMFRQHTHIPVLGVVPYLHDLGLPAEDSVEFEELPAARPWGADTVNIAVIRLPHTSNFTDFDALRCEPDVALRYVACGEPLGGPDLVIIPGTKNTLGDLQVLRASGTADALLRLHAAGTPVFGICGGYQMLGQRITDRVGAEGHATADGLGLLAHATEFGTEKQLRQVAGAHLPSGLPVAGYEIHMGVSDAADSPLFRTADGRTLGSITADGRAAGTYLHGVFDADAFRRNFLDALRVRKGLAPRTTITPYDTDAPFERLAATVRAALDMPAIYRILDAGLS